MYAELAKARAALCAEGQLFELEEVELGGTRVRAWKTRLSQFTGLLATDGWTR